MTRVETDATKRKEMLAKVTKLGTETYTALVIASPPVVGDLGPRVDIDFPITTEGLGLGVRVAKHRK